MDNLSIQRLDNFIDKSLVGAIPIWPVPGQDSKQEEKVSKDKVKKKTPLFYTAPIFKSKKHDFF